MSLGETAPSTDLGDSSKYSTENFQGRNGERFHVNSSSKYSTENFEGHSGEGFRVMLAHEIP